MTGSTSLSGSGGVGVSNGGVGLGDGGTHRLIVVMGGNSVFDLGCFEEDLTVVVFLGEAGGAGFCFLGEVLLLFLVCSESGGSSFAAFAPPFFLSVCSKPSVSSALSVLFKGGNSIFFDFRPRSDNICSSVDWSRGAFDFLNPSVSRF